MQFTQFIAAKQCKSQPFSIKGNDHKKTFKKHNVIQNLEYNILKN
ncbi:MAG: hypothetical protein K0R07_2411 [Sedimentibacter sp.]|jgi:hypothetical protein|nr:hypothetical protein [Sedimentibacter sp.]